MKRVWRVGLTAPAQISTPPPVPPSTRALLWLGCNARIAARELQRYLGLAFEGLQGIHVLCSMRLIPPWGHDPTSSPLPAPCPLLGRHSRYVGDILAWVHQAVAMEKELVAALFGSGSSGGGGNGNVRSNGHADGDGEDGDVSASSSSGGEAGGGGKEDEEEGILSAEEVLCKVLQGIARPLQVGGGNVWWVLVT